MLVIPGYKTHTVLYENKRYCIVRAIEINSQRKVVIKALNNLARTVHETRRIRQEFAVGQKINSLYSVQNLELYSDSQYLAIIQEDDDATDLEKIIPTDGFALAEFFNMAIQIVAGLADIHQANIIHKDIKPANLIVNTQTNRIKYIDYGSASQLKEENQPAQSLNKLEGTLAYISPEQTGRMNRAMDYRTDFYSLGVTFYQLLSGKLPFAKQEAMALIHCHLATTALPLHHIKPTIPEILAALVNKLLMKNAEDRYQSTQGILQDLKKCQHAFLTYGKIDIFELGQQDFSEKFQISQKLYGREKETAILLEAFERTSTGKLEVLAVAGYSGIGKSTLINEIQKPITLKNGRFLTGKFDQLSKTTAYSAISQAFQGLIKQLLAESESSIKKWREILLVALGNNGQIIADIIPEIEHIIGKQPTVAALGPVEAKNRFNIVFQNFMSAFTKKEHPLVLFLDDLQWADAASLELIRLFMTSPETCYFFLIGAYRDNEVDDSHVAIITLEAIKKCGIPVQPITLTSLDSATVERWIADSLNTSLSNAKSLAEIIYQKTQGNPFFVKMFFRSLYDENLLSFSEAQHWQWDSEKIKQRQATDNVVNFMVSRINQLSEKTQEILSLASCLGHIFHLDLLVLVSQKDREQLFFELQIICDAGMIYQNDDMIQFTHDRVQEAAYSLLTADQKKTIHLFIGRLLIKHYFLEQQPEKMFEVVDHLNIGVELIVDEVEKLELVKLNLAAGQKAKNAIAYAAAFNYIQSAISYFDEQQIWKNHYELAFSLYKEKAELEYLNGDFQASERIIQRIISLAHSPIEQAEMYNLLMIQKTLLTEDQVSIQLGKIALALLGIEMPEYNLKAVLEQEVEKINKNLGDKEISSLIDIPEMVDLHQRAAFKLLTTFMVPTIIADYDLYSVTVAKGVNLALEYGHMTEASSSYLFYGSMLCNNINTLQRGYEFGLLSIKLAQKYNNPAQECKILHVFSTLIHHWFKPLRTSKVISNQAYQLGLQSGEMQYAGYSRYSVAVDLFCSGEMLFDIAPELNKLVEFCTKTKSLFALDNLQGVVDAVQTLTGQKALELRSDYVLDLEKRGNNYALGHDVIYKSQLLYLYEQFDKALYYSLEAEKILSNVSAHYVVAEHNFYYSLNLAAVYNEASTEQQLHYQQQLISNQKTMAVWTQHCPENFQQKYWLVAAEVARIQEKPWQAGGLYDKAIKAAKDNGFIQDEALANEIAGKFWLTHANETIARIYLNQAYVAYQSWGAKAKVELFKKKYANLLKTTPVNSSLLTAPSYMPFATTSSTSSLLLDMDNVIRASQVISSDINLEKLLFSMMKIIIETAGAQKGVLLLNNNGVLSVEAEYTATGQINVLSATAMQDWQGARSVVEYVKNTGQTITLNRAVEDKQFGFDNYIAQQQLKSLLCMPIMKQDELKGILYIENNLIYFAFPQNRVTVLTILASQMAISLENARLVQMELQAANKIADEERRRAKEAEAYKHNLEEFIDTICHEIRNPLNGIMGSSELLQNSMDKFAALLNTLNPQSLVAFNVTAKQYLREQREFVESILQCTEQQKIIVNDVLDLSKIENNKLELNIVPCNPGVILTRVAYMFASQLTQKQLYIQTQNVDEIHWIEGDSARITQILVNLISNAIKFTHHGGITLSLAYRNLSESTIEVTFTVADTGVGIAADALPHLFERFAQAHSRVSSEYGGSGLGLAISKNLATIMGGQLIAISEVGKGSQLSFIFPCKSLSAYKQLETSNKNTAHSPQKTPGVAKNILIVDDSKLNQKILASYLKNLGHTYQIANDGIEALSLFEQHFFDVIFMDIEMPRMGGLEATQKIRSQEDQALAVWITGLSGNARKEQIDEALKAGMNDYLTKPYHKDDIILAIERAAQYETQHVYLQKNTSKEFNLNITDVEQQNIELIKQFKIDLLPLLTQQLPFLIMHYKPQLVISIALNDLQMNVYVKQLILQDFKKQLEKIAKIFHIEHITFEQQQLVLTTLEVNKLIVLLKEIGMLINYNSPLLAAKRNSFWQQLASFSGYTPQQIVLLLQHYLTENISQHKVCIIESLLATNWPEQNQLSQSLINVHQQRAKDQAEKHPTTDDIIIPINLNNGQWALLIMHYTQDLTQIPDIYYINPKNVPIHSKILHALQYADLFPSLEVVSELNTITLANDESYSGAWIIEVACFWMKHQQFPSPTDINIKNAQQQQQQVLNSINVNQNKKFISLIP
jgi:predicted ATPase/signal transduction histidine kinase/CheY-like chemotaxis protein/tRNA A-37 threonylcarbamoyl transferase component Bud32